MNFGQSTDKVISDFIYIYTLGDFRVHRGEKLLSLTSRRSQRFWRLFIYLVLNRSRNVSMEELLDNVWTDSENLKNPEQALRTSIYRLRRMFNMEAPQKAREAILSPQGSYRWNSDQCWMDIEEFEHKCLLGTKLARRSPDRACVVLKEALDLYKGTLLSGFMDISWIEPHRNYYRRLYVENVILLVGMLKTKGHFKNIIKISEKAALLEPFEEELHISLMEALLEEGKSGMARAHYEYVTSLYYRELGTKPSPAMRSIYRKLILDHESVEGDLSNISSRLREQESAKGAFQCDADIFRYIYKLEDRKMRRYGRLAFLVLFTLSHIDNNSSEQRLLARPMQQLNGVLSRNLRQGDVITRWNEAQFLTLLCEVDQKQAEAVIQRIEKYFCDQAGPGLSCRFVLHATLLPITPDHDNLDALSDPAVFG